MHSESAFYLPTRMYWINFVEIISSRPPEAFLIAAQQNKGLIVPDIRQRAGKLTTEVNLLRARLRFSAVQRVLPGVFSHADPSVTRLTPGFLLLSLMDARRLG